MLSGRSDAALALDAELHPEDVGHVDAVIYGAIDDRQFHEIVEGTTTPNRV